MKNNKGITLIALVITIIVLLILAGVSIAMLTGNNGILTQANTAKTDTAKAEEAERINMELNALYATVMADSTKAKFTADEITAVRNNLGDGYTVTPETGENATVTITATSSGKTGSITIGNPGEATLSPASK